MPLYDYECLSCGHVFELRQSFHSDPEAECPSCSGDSRRKFHAVPVIYKGSGFYTTDYKNASAKGTSPPKEKAKEEDGAKETPKKDKAPAGSSDDKKEATKEA